MGINELKNIVGFFIFIGTLSILAALTVVGGFLSVYVLGVSLPLTNSCLYHSVCTRDAVASLVSTVSLSN